MTHSIWCIGYLRVGREPRQRAHQDLSELLGSSLALNLSSVGYKLRQASVDKYAVEDLGGRLVKNEGFCERVEDLSSLLAIPFYAEKVRREAYDETLGKNEGNGRCETPWSEAYEREESALRNVGKGEHEGKHASRQSEGGSGRTCRQQEKIQDFFNW